MIFTQLVKKTLLISFSCNQNNSFFLSFSFLICHLFEFAIFDLKKKIFEAPIEMRSKFAP